METDQISGEVVAIILPKFPNSYEIHENKVHIVVAQIGDDYFAGKSHIFVSTTHEPALKIATRLCEIDKIFQIEIPPLPTNLNLSWFVCNQDPEAITQILSHDKVIIKKNKSTL